MSILIKGAEMPKNCFDCAFNCHINGVMWYPHLYTDKRHPDCPLVEIKTPHGDLVDREWLKGVAELNKDEYGEAIVDLDDLRNAPTVIEVEE